MRSTYLRTIETVPEKARRAVQNRHPDGLGRHARADAIFSLTHREGVEPKMRKRGCSLYYYHYYYYYFLFLLLLSGENCITLFALFSISWLTAGVMLLLLDPWSGVRQKMSLAFLDSRDGEKD